MEQSTDGRAGITHRRLEYPESQRSLTGEYNVISECFMAFEHFHRRQGVKYGAQSAYGDGSLELTLPAWIDFYCVRRSMEAGSTKARGASNASIQDSFSWRHRLAGGAFAVYGQLCPLGLGGCVVAGVDSAQHPSFCRSAHENEDNGTCHSKYQRVVGPAEKYSIGNIR